MARDSTPVSTTAVTRPRSPSLSPTRAREVLMIAGAGGAMRATGWRATTIRFQQFGEGGSVNQACCGHARARGGANSSALGQQTDLLDLLGPAGRRCGCWPTSTVLFSGIVVGRFGGGRWIGADADRLRLVGAAAMVPAPIERREVRGHRQQIGKSAALTVGVLALALSALRPLRLRKISGIWQR